MGFRVSRQPLLNEWRLSFFLSLSPSSLVNLLVLSSLPWLWFAAVPKVWYDNRADDLTKEGMLKGIEQAAAFVLFLSQGVLERPYCQLEIRHALALKKPIVLLHGERVSRTEAMRAIQMLPAL